MFRCTTLMHHRHQEQTLLGVFHAYLSDRPSHFSYLHLLRLRSDPCQTTRCVKIVWHPLGIPNILLLHQTLDQMRRSECATHPRGPRLPLHRSWYLRNLRKNQKNNKRFSGFPSLLFVHACLDAHLRAEF